MGSDKLFHKNKIRKAKELARHNAKKAPYEISLILTEGTKTECQYLREYIRANRLNFANIKVTPAKGSAPISIVEHAIEIANQMLLYEKIFCVFDFDFHESFDRALKTLNKFNSNNHLSNNAQIIAITSTPCFELWPLLHYRYTIKPYCAVGKKSASEILIEDLCKECRSYSKGSFSWIGDLHPKLDVAIANAKKLKKHNDKTNSKNLVTDMFILMEYLNVLQIR